jgi:DNA repair exonuclease SbcCD ATPase subunit
VVTSTETDDRHALAERLTDAEMALDEVEGERATLAEQLFDAREQLKALKKRIGEFTDRALGGAITKAEVRMHAEGMLAAIRGER